MSFHTRKERSSYVLLFQVIKIEVVYLVGYFISHRLVIVLWIYFSFILACAFHITSILFDSNIYQPYGGCIGWGMRVVCSVLYAD